MNTVKGIQDAPEEEITEEMVRTLSARKQSGFNALCENRIAPKDMRLRKS